jgi:ABC-type nitrate/sulfonate/bicarbonate transport system ATPase subunit
MDTFSYQKKDTLIKLDNVSLSFGDKVILKPISVEVKDIVREGCVTGQIIAILGPSGVGKTQLSRMLAGLHKPTTGAISVGNKLVEAGMVGMVAQNYPLFNHRTVIGNLLVALEHANITKQAAKDRVTEYLNRFDLLDKAYMYPASLSGGQRQRVSIIQEILCSEHYLILDEPTASLDIIASTKVAKLITTIANLHEENTIFIVSHDISTVCSIADQVWLLGRDKDENNKIIPGSYIKKQINLIERNICWRENISETKDFFDVLKEIKNDFINL